MGVGLKKVKAGKPAITATGTHMPYRITQCYLPPGRGDIPAFTPAKAGTRFSDPRPEGCKAELTQVVGYRWFTRLTVTHHELTGPDVD